MKQQVTDNEDTQDNVVPPQSVSSPTAFSRCLRSATPRSRSRSQSGSRSSSSSSSSAVAEADMEGFDFEESINCKRRELLADAANEKTPTAATASASNTENTGTDDAGKKPFINGIDMFAEELHIEAESYNVIAVDTSQSVVQYSSAVHFLLYPPEFF